jgi:hypothetical protein
MAKSSSHAKVARATVGKSSPKRVVVSFSVDESLLRRFDVVARHEERTRSSQIALLMRRWVEGLQP